MRGVIHVLAALALAPPACSAGGENDELPPNPIERRVEPVRDRASEADSLIRARQRAVEDLSGEA